MSKVATMLIRHSGDRYEIGDELPDKIVKKLGEDHAAVGDPPKKAKKKTADPDAGDAGGNAGGDPPKKKKKKK